MKPIKFKESNQQIRKILEGKPKVTRDWLNKQAEYLVNRFHKECNLTVLQRIGILAVLTEKGDLEDLLNDVGVEEE